MYNCDINVLTLKFKIFKTRRILSIAIQQLTIRFFNYQRLYATKIKLNTGFISELTPSCYKHFFLGVK
jgi:hypothetical protein